MGLTSSPPPAQITICGALNSASIAALVEVALAANAALMVQPRPLPAADADVVAAVPRPTRALPPSGRQARRGPVQRRSARRPARAAKPAATHSQAAVAAPIQERVRGALRDGPLLVSDFLKATGLSKEVARRLVQTGVIVATGATHGRRYALPGRAAKEAP